jgi:hypothetical protein
MTRAVRSLITPERLYIAALGLSGLAALLSIALIPAERGELVASMAGATLGSAIGGLSIDTFLMSRPRGWVWSSGAGWVGALTGACLLLSGLVAATVIAAAGIGSYLVGIGAACCLTLFNVCSSLALRLSHFRFVYAVRLGAAALVVVGYALFYVDGHRSGLVWALAYLAAQAAAALVMTVAVLRWAVDRRPADMAEVEWPNTGRLADITAIAKVHAGMSAHMLTSRLDQVLLARFSGAASLGVYALAVAALEFAQAGAVVRSQRILTRRENSEAIPRIGPVIAVTAPVAVAAVGGLAVLGLIQPDYHEAWLLGLLLLFGAVFSALGKVASAALFIRRGEGAPSVVAATSAVAAVGGYFLLIPWLGSVGAAVAMSSAYLVYAAAAFVGLRSAVPRAAVGLR